MLDLNELEQLIAFADLGTLSMAAEQLHISQPTITRTMQHLEEAFGVALFLRGKNRIALNESGKKAVEQARLLLAAAEDTLKKVQEFDRSLRTITVSSCAPAPLWSLLPILSAHYPGMTIASSLKNVPAVCTDLVSGACQLAVLPEGEQPRDCAGVPFLEEHLSVCLPADHALAGRASVTFSDLNGYNFLLRSEIGFWDEMCRLRMPSSRFLVQTNDFDFAELIRESALPCFITNLAGNSQNLMEGRVSIPVTDPEANVTYALVCQPRYREYLALVSH